MPTALGLALATARRESSGAPRYISSAWIRLRLAEMKTGETMARTIISRPANTAAAATQTQTPGRAGGTVPGGGDAAASTVGVLAGVGESATGGTALTFGRVTEVRAEMGS